MVDKITVPGDLADGIASLQSNDYINVLRSGGLLICFDYDRGIYITIQDGELHLTDQGIPNDYNEAAYGGLFDYDCDDFDCDGEDCDHDMQYYEPHHKDVVDHIHMNRFHDHIVKMLRGASWNITHHEDMAATAHKKVELPMKITPAVEQFIKRLANGSTSDISVMQKAQQLVDTYFSDENQDGA